MDDFARNDAKERGVYFREAATRMSVAPQIVEKDFWVCWTLKRLFQLPEFAGHLTFKGGTSLSKVYRLIERFSEDIDVSIDRHWLGFTGENGPEASGLTGKERRRRLEKLQEVASTKIQDVLFPRLKEEMTGQLGSEKWSLYSDPSDPLTLYFEYPASDITSLPFIAAHVKIELGVRSDHWPVEERTLTPYAADHLPRGFRKPEIAIRVLRAERTFWEKATQLHALCHYPQDKPLEPRNSRHYYDLAELIRGGIGSNAASDLELLARVVEHKTIFFRSGWATYHTAVKGTLRLTPPDSRLAEWEGDYEKMGPMFFKAPPPFKEVLQIVAQFQQTFNGAPLTGKAVAT